MSVLVVNGVTLPTPARGMNFQHQQLVDSGRNALGQVVAQTINRRLLKVNELHWLYLSREEWELILNEVNKFHATVTVYDPGSGGFVTRQMYWGDAEGTPLTYERDEDGNVTGVPHDFINCKANLIDMGKG